VRTKDGGMYVIINLSVTEKGVDSKVGESEKRNVRDIIATQAHPKKSKRTWRTKHKATGVSS
jgi:hypothetical protein